MTDFDRGQYVWQEEELTSCKYDFYRELVDKIMGSKNSLVCFIPRETPFIYRKLDTYNYEREMQCVQMGPYGCLVLGPHFKDNRMPAVDAETIVEAVCSRDY